MIPITTNFTKKEVTCNCGCGTMKLRHDLLMRLQVARVIADTRFVITSWTRCPEHNKRVGGAINSNHLRGFAVDIEHVNPIECRKIVNGLLVAEFPIIRIYKKSIHAAFPPGDPTSVLWWAQYVSDSH